MVLMVPNLPGYDGRKAPIQGFNCRVVGDHLSCEALVVAHENADGPLEALLYTDDTTPPQPIVLAWTRLEPQLQAYGRVEIDVYTPPKKRRAKPRTRR